MEGNQKQIGIAVLCLAAFGGIGIWWLNVGRFEASLECKAAKAQLADLRVSSRHGYIGTEGIWAEQAVTRYCKGSL